MNKQEKQTKNKQIFKTCCAFLIDSHKAGIDERTNKQNLVYKLESEYPIDLITAASHVDKIYKLLSDKNLITKGGE